jgi:hypothetical protein
MSWGEIDTHALISEIGELATQMRDAIAVLLRALVAVIDAPLDQLPRVEDWIAS